MATFTGVIRRRILAENHSTSSARWYAAGRSAKASSPCKLPCDLFVEEPRHDQVATKTSGERREEDQSKFELSITIRWGIVR
jgi:hypothetical protein